MDKRLLQTYAVWAKENLEQQIEVSLKTLGIKGDNVFLKAKQSGDYTYIEGDSNSYPASMYERRQEIISQVCLNGYKNIIEEVAYTWFNRLVALRFMELHGFLTHGFRVLSSTSGSIEPDIMKNLSLVKDDLRLDIKFCEQLKEQNRTEELFRYVLICQCNALSDILPMLFSRDLGYMELLLPKSLLIGETVLTKLVEIPEKNFMNDVEIIGWMYQFYISSKKDEVYASKEPITKETLPAVTQIFTPDWIVRYLAENSVGRIWMESYPQSPLCSSMKYYVDNPDQTEEVQRKLDEIKYRNVNPENLRIIEPCSGSGHILVYVMELLYKMYEEKGFNKRDIPTLILRNNLVGLDVDKRAAQLASFSLVMKARTLNTRFFREEYYTLPQVYELQDSHLLESLNYRKHMKEMPEFSDREVKAVSELVKTFENGKTVGSLIKVPDIDYVAIESVIYKLDYKVIPSTLNVYFVNDGAIRLKKLLIQAKILSKKYDVMITNPPYQATSSMEDSFREYAAQNYPKSKTDLFAMFMETTLVKRNGFQAMVTPQAWMFLSSYIELRKNLLSLKTLITLANFGVHAFEGGFGTDAWCMRNCQIKEVKGCYISLDQYNSSEEKKSHITDKANYIYRSSSLFLSFPNYVYAFWCPISMTTIFCNHPQIKDQFQLESGIKTGKNNLFLRFWQEVSLDSTYVGIPDETALNDSKHIWFRCNKGGGFNKWYGAFEYVIKIGLHGQFIRKEVSSSVYRLRDENNYPKAGITWPHVGDVRFSCKYLPKEIINDVAADAIYTWSDSLSYAMLAYLNSCVFNSMMKMINPTVNYPLDSIGNAHFIPLSNSSLAATEAYSRRNVDLCKADWDAFETSWDFQYHPMLLLPEEKAEIESTQSTKKYVEKFGSLTWKYVRWEEECRDRFNTLKSNEEELNRIFIDIYGLQDELTPEVEDKDVTVRLADRERDVKSLISYLVGVIMGRYSLDVPGLAYAGGDWDAAKYLTYQPDDDGIVPIYRGIGMEDGLTAQLIALLKLIYRKDTYRQNIDFIAESIGRNNNESSEEALNRYLNDGFFANHVKVYQKRPIYWLFTSGKNSGFKCLIYMHRYTSDTLARINSRYFLPESTRLKNDLEELNGRLVKADGRDRVRLEKERQKLAASYNEAIEYGQVLDHLANQYIEINLDDGVKTNYSKFQNVEMVTDSGNKVKKNLLAPLK